MSEFDKLPRDHPARLDMGGTGFPADYCGRCLQRIYPGDQVIVSTRGLAPPEHKHCPPTAECATCHTILGVHFVCDGALGEKCPHYPLEDA